jgi:hypothetical protein
MKASDTFTVKLKVAGNLVELLNFSTARMILLKNKSIENQCRYLNNTNFVTLSMTKNYERLRQ